MTDIDSLRAVPRSTSSDGGDGGYGFRPGTEEAARVGREVLSGTGFLSIPCTLYTPRLVIVSQQN